MSTQDTNHWLDEKCARAFWDQKVALPYQELLEDTARWLDVGPGERWLDLGCGGGQLTSLLWHKSGGQVREIVSQDCNPANADAIARLCRHLTPPAGPDRIRFVPANFSLGLPHLADHTFDGIVSGLAISYAESRDPQTGKYTDTAYNQLLAEMARVLRPGGRLVFSVNVPNVRFWPIFWKSLKQVFRISKPGRALLNGLKMQSYGRWLRGEAKRGRFHYLPVEEIQARLQKVGFTDLRFRLSYAGQAYVIGARRGIQAATRVA